MKYRIESAELNNIFGKWLAKNYPNAKESSTRSYYYHIDRINLKYGEGKAFDMFVWEHGGHIRTENKHRHVEFFDDHNATMFVLRWS